MEYVYNPPSNLGANYYDPVGADSFEGQYPGTPPAWSTWLFGDKGALNDRETWNLNQQAKYQEQALQVDLMNYQNQYNSPLQQMLRYQEAGLSPWLAYQNQQTPSAGPSGVASARASGTHGANAAQMIQASNGMISQMLGIARAGAEMYDYLKYGSKDRAWKVDQAATDAAMKNLQYQFSRWFLRDSGTTTEDSTDPLSDLFRTSLRGSQEQSKLTTSQERINQIKGMISLIPDQKARQKALLDLDEYRLGIMKGQNDAILNINTGYPGFDSFLRLVAYFLMNQKL